MASPDRLISCLFRTRSYFRVFAIILYALATQAGTYSASSAAAWALTNWLRTAASPILPHAVAHMFYAMVFLLLGSSGKPIDWSETVLKFREFHQRIWSGEPNLADNHMKTVYGRVHWEQLLQNMQQAGYNEAIKIAWERRAIL